ncbi:uncharacterized protein LOC130049242 isoform X2 [Ostrea edulis]|nr:uncharacterized protein LOC130046867 isoform X2 [Ostrea edulis]XP_055996164.1 uncharacterized protein LOC130046867 isoform X2 [Ostrea edulis]XP_056002590.1 uncharacterized protein LOC130049242 isoform X2 [Ostrea edulis]XP_056002591.1 uncharacterized protein LOC130049242 isoform X2 [Ostrea edulis]
MSDQQDTPVSKSVRGLQGGGTAELWPAFREEDNIREEKRQEDREEYREDMKGYRQEDREDRQEYKEEDRQEDREEHIALAHPNCRRELEGSREGESPLKNSLVDSNL